MNHALAEVLKRLCDIPAPTEAQRAALQAYSGLVIEIARSVHVLQRMGEDENAARLVGYASQVTDMARRNVEKAGET